MDSAPDFARDPHATTIPWVESPFFAQLLPHMNLDPVTEERVRRYADEGYVIIDPGFPEEVIDGAIRDLDGKYQGRVHSAWSMSQNVKTIATAPVVIDLLRVLYQREPLPFQTLNFNVGTEQKTHSDTIHFHSVPARFMCGVWIALEDVDAENGPLHYYPGSHKLPVYDVNDLGVFGTRQQGILDNYFTYEKFIQALVAAHGLKRIEVSLKKGQALIWSANLLHGGSPILDRSRTRHSQVTHYYFANCAYYTPALSDALIGRAYGRKIMDIRTTQEVPQWYAGVEISNPGEWPPRFVDEPQPAVEGAPQFVSLHGKATAGAMSAMAAPTPQPARQA